jgi:hypothetical protein
VQVWAHRYRTAAVVRASRYAGAHPNRGTLLADGVHQDLRDADPALYQRMLEHYSSLAGKRSDPLKDLAEEYSELERRWAQDCELIGRMLRAHLFVEHFMNDFIAHQNPNLPRSGIDKLPFAAKVGLLGDRKPWVATYAPALWALNDIRTDFGHRLDSKVSQKRIATILEAGEFVKYQEGVRAPVTDVTPPVEVVEAFARLMGKIFHGESSPTGGAIGAALQRALQDRRDGNL